MGEYFVYLINEKDTVKQRRIEVGPAQGEFVVVRSGLNPGDKIVLEGLQKVHPGSFVSADTTHIVNQASSTPNKAVQVNTESKSNPDEVKGSDKNNGTKNKGDKSKGESKKEEEKRGNKM
jgi:hypothetical protein